MGHSSHFLFIPPPLGHYYSTPSSGTPAFVVLEVVALAPSSCAQILEDVRWWLSLGFVLAAPANEPPLLLGRRVQGQNLLGAGIDVVSPLKSLWHLIFWTEPIRRSVTTVLACAALALELTLPFLLWSDSVTTHILELFNAVNRTPKARACTSTPWPSQPPCISE